MNQPILRMDGSNPQSLLTFPDQQAVVEFQNRRNLKPSYQDQLLMNPNMAPTYTYSDEEGTMVGGGNLNSFPQGQGVLTNSSQPISQSGILSQQQQGGNMRGSTRLPAVPRQKINMMGEGNMRMAGAGLGALGANMTGNEAIAAAAQEYGVMKDYNRQAEADALALEEDRRNAIADRISDNKDGLKGSIEEVATANAKMKTAMEVLQGLKDHDYVVGPASPFVRFYDQFTDNERENIRLKIKTLQVDRILSNVARTKGAISEKEMEIFASDIPSQMSGPETWTNWVKDYAEALRVMTINLQGGRTVGNYSDGSSSTSFDPGQPGNPTGSNNELIYDPETGTFSTVGG